MRIHDKLEVSEANGPGKRAVIWLQGCDLHCKGCFNPTTWDKNGGTEISTVALMRWLLDARDQHGLTGVTLSGGEPLQQPTEVLSLQRWIESEWYDCSIGLFTGYKLEEAERVVPAWPLIRARLDFAVMGRYVEGLPSTANLLGSSNQKVELFTNRYRLADFAGQQKIEITVEPGGLAITGLPRGAAFDAALARYGLKPTT